MLMMVRQFSGIDEVKGPLESNIEVLILVTFAACFKKDDFI